MYLSVTFYFRGKYHKLKYGTELNPEDLKPPVFDKKDGMFAVLLSLSFSWLILNKFYFHSNLELSPKLCSVLRSLADSRGGFLSTIPLYCYDWPKLFLLLLEAMQSPSQCFVSVSLLGVSCLEYQLPLSQLGVWKGQCWKGMLLFMPCWTFRSTLTERHTLTHTDLTKCICTFRSTLTERHTLTHTDLTRCICSDI